MPLKKGTIPVVDEYLIQAVKYALDQIGANLSVPTAKHRRTCLDGTPAPIPEEQADNSYNSYFKVIIEEKNENGKITKVKVIDGGSPLSYTCGTTDMLRRDQRQIESAVLDVDPGTDGDVALVLYVEGQGVQARAKNKLVYGTPDIAEAGFDKYTILARVRNNVSDDETSRGIHSTLTQVWLGGAIYWAERFFL